MNIITDNKRLPRTALTILATFGWVCVVYLAWEILGDSIDRTEVAIKSLQGLVPAQINPFEDRYTANPWETLAHAATGIVFAVLGPLQFVAPLRRKFPRLHRISGRIFLPMGILSGVAAFVMTLTFPIWGSAQNMYISLGFSAFMVFAFIHAFRLVLQRQFARHREWMMRGFATGLAVALFRVGLNDVLPELGFDFNQSWDIVMISSFPIMLIAAEIWIRVTRPANSGK